jgi:hypothetical protein
MTEKILTPEEIAALMEADEPPKERVKSPTGALWRIVQDEEGDPIATTPFLGLDRRERTLVIGFKGLKKFARIILPDGKIKTQEMINDGDMLAIRKAWKMETDSWASRQEAKDLLNFLTDKRVARNVWDKLVEVSAVF